MNNQKDPLVPYAEELSFILDFVDYKKRVWMLQYDEGGHGSGGGKNTIDYTIRSNQFLIII